MNKIIMAVAVVLFCGAAFAEEAVITPKAVKITIQDCRNYPDYQQIFTGIKAIEGVEELVPYKMSSGDIVLTGRLASSPDDFKNDVQALVLDKYKYNGKETSERLDITLKKLQ
jgi:hypothetical protein